MGNRLSHKMAWREEGKGDCIVVREEIFDLQEEKVVPDICQSILSPINTCRQMINEEAAASSPATGDLSLQMLMAKLAALEQVEQSAQIEVALCRALSSGPGEAKLEQQMMMALPSKEREITLTQALSNLERLAESTLHNLCGITAQSKLSEVLSALKSLCRGHPPCFTAWGGMLKSEEIER